MFEKIKDKLRVKFINWLVKDLYNAIDEENVLKVVEIKYTDRTLKKVYFRGQELAPYIVSDLQRTAKEFSKSDIWRVLSAEVGYQASKTMFDTATTESSMIFGKAALWTLKVINNKIKQIAE
jgi:hypothetical protein